MPIVVAPYETDRCDATLRPLLSADFTLLLALIFHVVASVLAFIFLVVASIVALISRFITSATTDKPSVAFITYSAVTITVITYSAVTITVTIARRTA